MGNIRPWIQGLDSVKSILLLGLYLGNGRLRR